MTDDTTKKPENPMLRIKSFEEGWQVFTRAVRHMPPDVQELVPMSIWKTVFYAGGRTVMGLVHDAVISGEGAEERTRAVLVSIQMDMQREHAEVAAANAAGLANAEPAGRA